MTTGVKVVLVDDHTLFRRGLAELLEGTDAIRVVGATGSPDDALRLVREHAPDVLIVDLHMPPHGGLHLMRRLAEAGWCGPTLVLTVSDSQEDMAAALRGGARGYLLKDMEPEDVVEAIHRALRGETVVAPAMTLKLVDLLHPRPASAAKAQLLDQLTAREREILDYLSRGLTNKAIGRALAISHDTVKLHVRRILSKLNLTSRVEAAVYAVEHKAAAAREKAP